MRRTIFLIVLACAVNISIAQNVLQITNVSQPTDVYSSVDDEAAVVIRCNQNIPLTFTSSMDKSAVPFRTELQGSDSIYYIAFPTGSRYRGRTLYFFSKGYDPVSYALELQPKQLVTLKVINPNALVDAGCYREHRNKGVAEIKNKNYEEARNQFIVAKECSDADTTENNKNITLVETLIDYRQKGDAAYKLLEYKLAQQYYEEIIRLNPYDDYAFARSTQAAKNFLQECDVIFSKAEHYFLEKEYDKAKELYQNVINKECTKSAYATERINYIESLFRAKKDHARVLTYEWRKDVPFGFSYGGYHMHKAGGFFQMDMNEYVLKAIRSECQYGDEKFPEMNMSFGWTVKIANPVWIHFGPGVTGKMYYGTYLKDQYPQIGYGETDLLDTSEMGDLTKQYEEIPDNYKDAWTKANFGIAISPVIGITVKYSYFALRVTYQYRWTIQSKLEEFISKSRISVGAGIAF